MTDQGQAEGTVGAWGAAGYTKSYGWLMNRDSMARTALEMAEYIEIQIAPYFAPADRPNEVSIQKALVDANNGTVHFAPGHLVLLPRYLRKLGSSYDLVDNPDVPPPPWATAVPLPVRTAMREEGAVAAPFAVKPYAWRTPEQYKGQGYVDLGTLVVEVFKEWRPRTTKPQFYSDEAHNLMAKWAQDMALVNGRSASLDELFLGAETILLPASLPDVEPPPHGLTLVVPQPSQHGVASASRWAAPGARGLLHGEEGAVAAPFAVKSYGWRTNQVVNVFTVAKLFLASVMLDRKTFPEATQGASSRNLTDTTLTSDASIEQLAEAVRAVNNGISAHDTFFTGFVIRIPAALPDVPTPYWAERVMITQPSQHGGAGASRWAAPGARGLLHGPSGAVAASAFQGIGGEFVIDHQGWIATTGTDDWQQILGQTDVNLSNPDKKNLFFYVALPETKQDTYRYGVITANTPTLIALCQESLLATMRAMAGDPAAKIDLPMDGKFDCRTASYMVVAAQLARGQGVGNVNVWPLDAVEFVYLMNTSATVQNAIGQAMQKAGSDPKGALVVIPQAAKNLKFVGAQPPKDCKPIVGTGGETTLPGKKDGGLSTISDTDAAKAKGTSWWVIGGVGVALLGVGALAYSLGSSHKAPPGLGPSFRR